MKELFEIINEHGEEIKIYRCDVCERLYEPYWLDKPNKEIKYMCHLCNELTEEQLEAKGFGIIKVRLNLKQINILNDGLNELLEGADKNQTKDINKIKDTLSRYYLKLLKKGEPYDNKN
jgi:hypothetical protein